MLGSDEEEVIVDGPTAILPFVLWCCGGGGMVVVGVACFKQSVSPPCVCFLFCLSVAAAVWYARLDF